MSIIVKNGSSDPSILWTDRLRVEGTWCANLFQFILRSIQRLSQDLKLPFQLGTDLFRRGESGVHEAIREALVIALVIALVTALVIALVTALVIALVNALIHADYQVMEALSSRNTQTVPEFSNPGSLLISLEQLFRSNVSECRNKSLQTMFMMIGTAEKAGPGTVGTADDKPHSR